MPDNVMLEICTVALDYAVAAQRAGASRIELCHDLPSGGVTPDIDSIKAARRHLQIPIHILIRPRAGDFCYSSLEFEIIRKQIAASKHAGMDGIVVGLLDRNSQIDVDRTRELVELAHPLPVTFHRAFDQTADWLVSLEAAIQTGAQRVLTSGFRLKAVEGLSALAELVRAAGDRIKIMPGGGITSANVIQVVRATSAREIHASLLTPALNHVQNGADRSSQVALYHDEVLKVVSLLRPQPQKVSPV